MRRLVDPIVLGVLIFLVGLAYYASQVSGMLVMYLLTCYAALWAVVIIAIRGSIHGNELRQRIREFEDEGRSYHKFSWGIMLLAFTPLALMLLVLVVIPILTLR